MPKGGDFLAYYLIKL